MKTAKNISTRQHHRSDVAILFLRLFIGGVMLLHIVGKMQAYDNILLTYHRILGLDAATSFAVITILEGLFAAMIILGVATRFASAMMLIVVAMSIAEALLNDTPDVATAKLNFVYMGIYITLLISGGGRYAFNVPNLLRKNGPKG
ncbi:MAG: DoxX family protein [Alistipes sp.]|nr:DoxX family protein [Alistipes sp.]MBR2628158.1 DoxX family protein [Alistipes sp.]